MKLAAQRPPEMKRKDVTYVEIETPVLMVTVCLHQQRPCAVFLSFYSQYACLQYLQDALKILFGKYNLVYKEKKSLEKEGDEK